MWVVAPVLTRNTLRVDERCGRRRLSLRLLADDKKDLPCNWFRRSAVQMAHVGLDELIAAVAAHCTALLRPT